MFNKKPKASPMSTRKPEAINQEYLSVVAQLGELEYNYRTIPDRQTKLINKISELQSEMEAVQAVAQEHVRKAQEAATKLKSQGATPIPTPVPNGNANAQS